MDKPRILFEHDGRHPLIYMYEPPIQREELEAAVDELVGTPVEALMLTLGDCRTLLCDLQAGQLWGTQIDKWPHIIWRRANQKPQTFARQRRRPPASTVPTRPRQRHPALHHLTRPAGPPRTHAQKLGKGKLCPQRLATGFAALRNRRQRRL